MRPLHTQIATVFGAGYFPYASGTFGSLVALLPGWYLLHLGIWPLIAGAIISLWVGVWASGEYEARSGVKDHSRIVIDELCGQWIALIPLAVYSPTDSIVADLFAAFLLFRLFDIWKPWPIRLIDRHVKGGAGVMFDDVLAGMCAGGILWAWAVL